MSLENLPSLPGSDPKKPKASVTETEAESPKASMTETEVEIPKSSPNEKKAATFSISDIDRIDAGEETASSADGPAGPARLSKDDFFSAFKMMFAVPNMVPVPPLPLKSLPIRPDEMDAARAASDAVYEIACETPYLSWLVEPGSEWMQRAMVIGTFSFGKLMAIKLELDARRRSPPQEPPSGEAPEGEAAAPEEKPKASSKGDAATVVHIK